MEVVAEGNALAIRSYFPDGSYRAQATIRVNMNYPDEMYEVYGWFKDNTEHRYERMGLLSPEKWGFNPNNFRSCYGTALAFVALHGGGVVVSPSITLF